MDFKLVTLVLLLVFFAGTVLFVFVLLRKRGNRLYEVIKDIANRINGAVVKRPVSYYFGEFTINPWYMKGHYKGYDFLLDCRVSKIPAGELLNGENDFLFLRIYLNLNSKLKMKILIFRDSPGTIFMVKRVETNDVNFDKQCYVYSNLPEQAKQYFHDGTLRNMTLHLLDLGWNALRIENKRCYVTKNMSIVDLNYGFIEETLEAMISLESLWNRSVQDIRGTDACS